MGLEKEGKPETSGDVARAMPKWPFLKVVTKVTSYRNRFTGHNINNRRSEQHQ